MHEHNNDIITGWRAKIYNRLMSIFGARRVYEQALSFVEISAGQRLLDIGCGTGTFLKMASEQFPGAQFSGVDASEDMLVEARKALGGRAVGLHCADAAHLPFPDSSFDVVVSILSFHHLPAGVKIRAIQEIARVTKKEGKCLIVDFGAPASLWGSCILLFLNFHSYARGNMALVERELTRWRLTVERREGLGGFVTALHARRQ